MDSVIRSLIEAAIQAPSGENSQPWRFRVGENHIDLYNETASDESLYNCDQWGSLISHGAAIENIVLQAASLGFRATPILFPDVRDPSFIARIDIAPESMSADDSALAPAIALRSTNRKPYAKKPLKAVDSGAIDLRAREMRDGTRLLRFSDVQSISRLAEVGSGNERIMLGNQELHSFFFAHVTWTPEEDTKVRHGFYIKTLELPGPAVAMFKLIRRWSVAKLLASIRFPILVSTTNAKTYSASSEIGVITVKDMQPGSFIAAGRGLQRIWLTAASNGLQMQPLIGLLFLHLFALHGPTGHLSESERAYIARQYRVLEEIAGSGTGIPIAMYRIGYGDGPSARSIRFPLEHFLYD